jgi:hypothetical protein
LYLELGAPQGFVALRDQFILTFEKRHLETANDREIDDEPHLATWLNSASELIFSFPTSW